MNKKMSFLSRGNRGFLLLEVLIGLLVFMGTTLIISRYLSQAKIQQQNATARLQAVMLARTHIEKIIAQKKLPKYIQKKHNQFTVVIQSKPFVLPRYDVNQFMLIEVTVSWKSIEKQNHTITITAGMLT